MNKTPDSYGFIYGSDGQKSIAVVDQFFNPNTQAFLLKSGLKPGMKVLEIGCGSGSMSCWLAEQVGNEGIVIAIDNHEHALMATKAKVDSKKLTNLKLHLISAYDIETLNEHFDLVYCRFVLHHLYHPTQVIQKVFNLLKPKGIFVAEEGITSSAFTYPSSEAWGEQRWHNRHSMEDLEGHERDPNFGMKLFFKMAESGFQNTDTTLFQPVLSHKKDKQLLLTEMLQNRDLYIQSGGKLADWQYKFHELEKMVIDNHQSIAFYQSCQVSGIKFITT